MTDSPTDLPVPIRDALDTAATRRRQVHDIEDHLQRLDAQIVELIKALAEHRALHAAKGRERTARLDEAAMYRRMAELLAAEKGIPLPAEPASGNGATTNGDPLHSGTFPVPSTPISPCYEDPPLHGICPGCHCEHHGAEQAARNEEEQRRHVALALQGAADDHAAGDPNTTQYDLPGGDSPTQGDFQPGGTDE